MKHYSKQREAILEVLRSTDTHPTANWIYEKVREKIPNISLGTVYRNLAGLTADGAILEIDVGDGFEHYDGDISPHLHLYCRECGKIHDHRIKNDYIADTAKESGFTTDTTIYVAYGICKNCN
jgi:Fur family peroxide stress response transcriptional regulator